MCGIAGVISNESQSISSQLLEDMASALQSRGPDASGTWIRNQVGLTHRRLRVLDVDTRADQPFVSADEKLCVVYNGEIYNFKDLRVELEKLGKTFRTQSDTEVLLYAYEQWGVDAFLKLNGMFAFAIADFRNPQGPEIYLVRDRYGIKPLFYSETSQGIVFGSEVKPFLFVPWIKREIDPQTLFWYLKFSHIPHPQSIFKSISQVEPGQWLSIKLGRVQKNFYWKWKFHENHSPSFEGDEFWIEKCSDVFSRCVGRQMISDVPVGCFISGGIDSSLLLSRAVEVNPKIETFTLSYSEKEFDETPFAGLVAKHFNVPFHSIQMSHQDLLSYAARLPDFLDQPFADPTFLPTALLCEKAKSKVTVALSGDGGDELFFGYHYQVVLRWLYPLLWVPVDLKNKILIKLRAFLYRQNPQKFPYLSKIIKAIDVLQFSDEAELFQNFIGSFGPVTMSSLHSLFSKDVRNQIKTKPSWFDRYLDKLENVDINQKIESIFLQTFLVDTVLTKSDRSGMSHGLEVRVPFLDHELLEFSQTLPFRMKYRLGRTKWILRKLLAKSLPSEITQRPKQGFSIPMRDWMKGPLDPLLKTYLSRERIQQQGWFDFVYIHKLLLEHQSGMINHSHLLWSLLVFQIWNEKHGGELS